MWTEIVLRIICVILLACAFICELCIQDSPMTWIDWIVLFAILIADSISIIGEICYTDDAYTKSLKIYDYDRIFKRGFWLFRLINAIICICLLWKLHEIENVLPVTFSMYESIIVIVGLFTVLNFYYWLIGLLSILCLLFVWNSSGLQGFWLYSAVIGTIVLGGVIMFIVAININNWRWEQSRARAAERKARELKEENEFMRRELKKRLENENKWWKFWN